MALVGTIVPDNTINFRNRIINGDMRIDQRNAGAAVTVNVASSVYTLDRWRCSGIVSEGVFTVQQDSSAPAGFNNSAKITVTTADASVSSGQTYMFQQRFEGYNIADFGFGTASAKTITISFWVRSSLTGTFGAAICNADQNRNYPFQYTISVADTWEYKTVTIPGETTGTWVTTNASALLLTFQIGAGPDRTSAAGAWNSTANAGFGANSSTQIISTLNATWYITGVQLEVGSVATPFERRPYGTELSLCQRYFWSATPASGTCCYAGGVNIAGSTGAGGLVSVPYPVTMRTTPSLSTIGSTIYCDNFSLASSGPVGNISLNMSSNDVGRVYLTNITVTGGSFSVSQAFNVIIGHNSTTGGLLFSAEL